LALRSLNAQIRHIRFAIDNRFGPIADLATGIRRRRSVLCLLQYERNLLFTEPTLLHVKISSVDKCQT
jgi:hypothetical protein